MGFINEMMEDVDEIFFDKDFFGSIHRFDGKEITVIVDSDERQETRNQWKDRVKDEVNKNSVLLFVKSSDMERRLAVHSDVDFDGEIYFVSGLWKQEGIWKILLERNQV